MRRAAIVAPIRTAVGKYGGSLKSLTAGDLGAVVIKALMERTKVDPERIDDVVFSQGYGNGEAPCIGRWSALAAGLPESIPGVQLDRRCGSGLQAVIDAAISTGTMAGVGVAMDPPKFLKVGDVVEIEVEGIGKIVNTVIDEPQIDGFLR